MDTGENSPSPRILTAHIFDLSYATMDFYYEYKIRDDYGPGNF